MTFFFKMRQKKDEGLNFKNWVFINFFNQITLIKNHLPSCQRIKSPNHDIHQTPIPPKLFHNLNLILKIHKCEIPLSNWMREWKKNNKLTKESNIPPYSMPRNFPRICAPETPHCKWVKLFIVAEKC